MGRKFIFLFCGKGKENNLQSNAKMFKGIKSSFDVIQKNKNKDKRVLNVGFLL